MPAPFRHARHRCRGPERATIWLRNSRTDAYGRRMVTTRDVSYTADGRTMVGRLAVPDGPGPNPAVLLAHEGAGLDDVQRARADEYAALGYAAFALDYIGGGQPVADREWMYAYLAELHADPDRIRGLGAAGGGPPPPRGGGPPPAAPPPPPRGRPPSALPGAGVRRGGRPAHPRRRAPRLRGGDARRRRRLADAPLRRRPAQLHPPRCHSRRHPGPRPRPPGRRPRPRRRPRPPPGHHRLTPTGGYTSTIVAVRSGAVMATRAAVGRSARVGLPGLTRSVSPRSSIAGAWVPPWRTRRTGRPKRVTRSASAGRVATTPTAMPSCSTTRGPSTSRGGSGGGAGGRPDRPTRAVSPRPSRSAAPL